jgi:hypothetical protein
LIPNDLALPRELLLSSKKTYSNGIVNFRSLKEGLLPVHMGKKKCSISR